MEGFHHFQHSMTLFTGGLMLFSIVIVAGLCFLEVRLAQEKEWWKGLIPPFALLLIGNIGNIVAVILLIVYGVVRYRGKKKRELEEMKIKDL